MREVRRARTVWREVRTLGSVGRVGGLVRRRVSSRMGILGVFWVVGMQMCLED